MTSCTAADVNPIDKGMLDDYVAVESYIRKTFGDNAQYILTLHAKSCRVYRCFVMDNNTILTLQHSGAGGWTPCDKESMIEHVLSKARVSRSASANTSEASKFSYGMVSKNVVEKVPDNVHEDGVRERVLNSLLENL